ncbi:MAG: hypothetical protein KM310_05555 [Clostridiales bacterium]|nr:hypothetical protein [Clostridiales bacterium]
MSAEQWGLIAGAIATIAVWTYLVDNQNPIWEFIQHLYIGLAYGWTFGLVWHTYIKQVFIGDDFSLRAGQWWMIIPVILGLLIYTRYIPSISWIARYPLSIALGWGAGYVLTFSAPVFIGQVTDSFYQLWGLGSTSETLNNWLLLLVLLGTLTYFFFTVRRDANAVMKGGVWVGRWAIMVTLGAMFGNTVLYRYNLFYARMKYILVDVVQGLFGGGAG